MKPLVTCSLFLFTSGLLAETVPMKWDLPPGFDAASIVIQVRTELPDPQNPAQGWADVVTLPPTDTTYIDDQPAGVYLYRVIGRTGTLDSTKIAGIWVIVPSLAPTSMSTP